MTFSEIITSHVKFTLEHNVDANALLVRDPDEFWNFVQPFVDFPLDRTKGLPDCKVFGVYVIEAKNIAEPWRLARI